MGGANLAKIDWGDITILGDERGIADAKAREKSKNDDWFQQVNWAYISAIRAYRQLASELGAQGLTGMATQFRYRSEQLTKEKTMLELRHFRPMGYTSKARLIFSWMWSNLLAAVSGYGFSIRRPLFSYGLTLIAFALVYMLTNGAEGFDDITVVESMMLSINSFHGRWFFQHPTITEVAGGDAWIMALVAAEGLIGLFLQAVLIASLTQRFVRR